MKIEKSKLVLFVILGVLLGLVLFLKLTNNINVDEVTTANFDRNEFESNIYDNNDNDNNNNNNDFVNNFKTNSYHRFKTENILLVGKSEPIKYAKIFDPNASKENNENNDKDKEENNKDNEEKENNNKDDNDNENVVLPKPIKPGDNNNNNSNSNSNNSNNNDNQNGIDINDNNDNNDNNENNTIMANGINTKNNKEIKIDVNYIHNVLEKGKSLPVNENKFRIKNSFGWNKNKTNFNYGLDIDGSNMQGEEVYAITDGIIAFTNLGEDKTKYGNVIVLNHGEFDTVYSQLEGFARGIKIGDEVKAGDLIGYVGNTGKNNNTSKAYLHIEFDYNDIKVNPISFLVRDNTNNNINSIDFNKYKNKYNK